MEPLDKFKRVDIRKQTKLSLHKSFNLTLKGISYRLFRSSLTLSVVVLAVAFFMALLSENSYIRSISEGVNEEVKEQRAAVTLLNVLYSPIQPFAHSEKLALAWMKFEDDGNDRAFEEYARVTDIPRDEIEKAAKACFAEQVYLAFFDNMRPGDRIALAGKAQGAEIFRHVSGNTQEFFSLLKSKPHLKLPEEEDVFRKFLAGYSSHTVILMDISMKWEKSLTEFQGKSFDLTKTGEEGIEKWIQSASEDDLRKWGGLIKETGFSLEDETLKRIQKYLQFSSKREHISAVLSVTEKKNKWKIMFKKDMSLSEKMVNLGHANVVAILDNVYTKKELKEISKKIAYERKLAKVEKTISAKIGASNVRSRFSSEGILSGKRMFLLGVSFVVCMVGIANAMLMSITERFKEIATMKCLGATDGFILVQFLMEAGIQGVAGGVLGMGIGLILAFVKNTFVFGTYVFAYFPWLSLLASCFVSLFAGMILAMIASVYPSWTASRMAPMEAMRIE